MSSSHRLEFYDLLCDVALSLLILDKIDVVIYGLYLRNVFLRYQLHHEKANSNN